jgi:hypothetical protein
MLLADGVPRRGLLLHEGTPALDRPDGSVVKTIRYRMFVDIYDVWPLLGEPTHYRVGNRGAIGWVRAEDLLPWCTRLVRRPNSGSWKLAAQPSETPVRAVTNPKTVLPILNWNGGWIQEAAWNPSAPWSEVQFVGWEKIAPLEAASAGGVASPDLGLLLTREELLELMRQLLATPEVQRDTLRLRASLGMLLLSDGLGERTRTELANLLPSWLFQVPSRGRDQILEALGRLNDDWKPVASWGSLEFAFVPLALVP